MADKFTQNCYAKLDGGVETLVQGSGFYPCGTVNSTSDFLTCCYEFDTCVGNNICKASTEDLSIEAQYYLGYCNDPTYTASVCNNQCLDLESNGSGSIGVQYNNTLSEWACCTDTKCTGVSDNVFKAPAPSSLTVIATPTSRPYSSFSTVSASTSSVSSSTSSSSQITISNSSGMSSTFTSSLLTTPTSTSSSTSHSSPKLSSGAVAAIAVAAVVIVALVGLLAFFVMRSRRRRQVESTPAKTASAGESFEKPELAAQESGYSGNGSDYAKVPMELGGQGKSIEAGGREIPEMGDQRNQAWELEEGKQVHELS